MSTTQPGLNGTQDIRDHAPSKEMAKLSLSTQSVHADNHLNKGQDVAPALHVSTTYRYSNDPETLKPLTDIGPDNPYDGHIYSRHTAPNTTRFESLLSTLLKGPALSYSSGLSAFHAALVFLNPKNIAIGDGYHGCHGVIGIHTKLTGLRKLPLDCAIEELGKGDIIHVETPLNPTGEARNLQYYADRAHSVGAYMVVDATFAPPPLMNPFDFGADIVMHSGTKYFGGHSDMLCGILAVHPDRAKEGWLDKLQEERLVLGNVMGNMEGWLGIRSVRTLEVRVERQSYNVGKLVAWLDTALHPEVESSVGDSTLLSSGNAAIIRKCVKEVKHASLQKDALAAGWLQEQMPKGFGPVFSIIMQEEAMARKLPSKLALFDHATSLGGVESLIEWRTMSDDTVDRRLMRVSVGIEGWEDLRDDLLQGFKALVTET